MKKPLCIDLYSGLGGWAEGFLSEGYDVVGFDIERHDYGTGGYPGQLVIQDVMTLHGRQFRDAAVIVASPPCQAYSRRAMPFGALWQEHNRMDDDGAPAGNYLGKDPIFNHLFATCFRIAREAGRPIVIENVRGAQKFVGPAAWHFGSYYLWGDVPALMPSAKWCATWTVGARAQKRNPDGTNHGPGSWFAIADSKHRGSRAAKVPGIKLSDVGFNVAAAQRYREGVKQQGSGPEWFNNGIAKHSSRSNSRKAASAQIAKIPFPLAQWIARVYKPDSANATTPTRRDPREERQHKELEKLRKFQAECMEIFRGPEQGWSFKEGAYMGMADALAEECLILKEMKDRGMK
jgi:hypothetical protein